MAENKWALFSPEISGVIYNPTYFTGFLGPLKTVVAWWPGSTWSNSKGNIRHDLDHSLGQAVEGGSRKEFLSALGVWYLDKFNLCIQ